MSVEDFNKLLDITTSPVFVLYAATFCSPCRILKPMFTKQAETNTSIVFIIIDAEDGKDLMIEHGVTKLPTMKVFVDGKVVDQMIGADVDKFDKLVKKYSTTKV